MKVRATDVSAKLKVGIKELHRIATPGEEFDVTNARYKILSGDNRYRAVFVINVDNNDVSEDKPRKKSSRKKTKKEEEIVVEESLISNA